MVALRGFGEPSRQDLIRFFTLSASDLDFVAGRRSDSNRLGTAVQLCTHPGARVRAGRQRRHRLGAPRGPGQRPCHRNRGLWHAVSDSTEHLVEVLAFEGWVTAAPAEWKAIDEFLFARALEHDSPRLLFNAACEFLRASRIMRPGVLRLLEHVATARERADDETWDRLSSNLSTEQRQVLDELLVIDASAGGSRHEWLERAPTKPNAASLRPAADRTRVNRASKDGRRVGRTRTQHRAAATTAGRAAGTHARHRHRQRCARRQDPQRHRTGSSCRCVGVPATGVSRSGTARRRSRSGCDLGDDLLGEFSGRSEHPAPPQV